jgi:hypothetical protein
MQKSNFLLTLTLLAMSIWTNAFAEPAITSYSVRGTTIKFTVQLSEKLFSGYKVKIDLQNGKGFVAMKCSALTCTLSSNALPQYKPWEYDVSYSVGIYDSKGAVDSSYVITMTPEVNAVPTASTFSYAKISNSGATLPDTAQLGTGTTDWACTKDNQTGLIWEVKTTDGGLRDMKNTYTWYEPDASKNGGNAGYPNGDGYPEYCKGSLFGFRKCDTYAFTNAVNANGLCGKKDWRMPTIEELKGLLTYPLLTTTRTFDELLTFNQLIDATYFPNTNTWFWTWFWSSSPVAGSRYGAWSVDFYTGYSNYDVKSFSNNVRLVRG